MTVTSEAVIAGLVLVYVWSIFFVVKEKTVFVIERLGSYNRKASAGLYLKYHL